MSDIFLHSDEKDAVASLGYVIWTPHFIVIFALTLVLGLGAESLLTQGWLNNLYRGAWVFLGHDLLLLGCWIMLMRVRHSSWLRAGSVFGYIWVFFTVAQSIAHFFPLDSHSLLSSHLSAAADSALLGSYVCLSTRRIPVRRWDSWFFLFAPLAAIGVIMAIFFLPPAELHSVSRFETTTINTVLVLCICIWWLRPSCWTSQPCTTFLFGVAPTLLLLLRLANVTNRETNFFFSQVMMLCLLLGLLRVLQEEVQASRV